MIRKGVCCGAQAQEERNGILDEAAEKGSVSYTGWRTSLKGTRFEVRALSGRLARAALGRWHPICYPSCCVVYCQGVQGSLWPLHSVWAAFKLVALQLSPQRVTV